MASTSELPYSFCKRFGVIAALSPVTGKLRLTLKSGAPQTSLRIVQTDPVNENILDAGFRALQLDTTLDMAFTFGIDLTQDLTSGEAFFIQVASMTATGSVAATNMNFELRLGFVDLSVTNGSANLNGVVNLTLNDPAPDGKITRAELTGTALQRQPELTRNRR